MLTRTRFLAGVISTSAFLFLLAWGVQASMCAAEVELAGSGMAHGSAPGMTPGMTHGMTHRVTHDMMHDVGSGIAHAMDSAMPDASMPGHDCEGAHAADAGMPHCPVVAAGSTCQTASSLPAILAAAQSATEADLPVRLVQTERLLLLSFELFRPPRA